MNLISIFREKNGSMSIEFAIVCLCFFVIIYFSANIGIAILQHNKLERVNYSSFTLMRERTKLYGNSLKKIDQNEVNELLLATKQMLGENLSQHLQIQLEAIYFDKKSTENNRIIKETIKLISQTDTELPNSECFSDLPPTKELHLYSAWSAEGWIPIIRLSLCAKNTNLIPITFLDNTLFPSLYQTSSLGMIR
ncbi:tight adherence protein F [Orbus hercynius]|uniref:Tight adherence protein F n=1 Tax=Orbus hercynius TaxID=593135 RepID=A0A495RJN0_9GAMM|nr:tight adherence pilus pseudopilin TadF [Orbus hercynius]RKS87727.1 tight adherence protein F [Orbus hercynius]